MQMQASMQGPFSLRNVKYVLMGHGHRTSCKRLPA